ncbi:Adenosylhomocysteinase [Burkholderia gladioli]|nr:Adenosylhomocysteinase [Burkholderia gladioli]
MSRARHGLPQRRRKPRRPARKPACGASARLPFRCPANIIRELKIRIIIAAVRPGRAFHERIRPAVERASRSGRRQEGQPGGSRGRGIAGSRYATRHGTRPSRAPTHARHHQNTP